MSNFGKRIDPLIVFLFAGLLITAGFTNENLWPSPLDNPIEDKPATVEMLNNADDSVDPSLPVVFDLTAGHGYNIIHPVTGQLSWQSSDGQDLSGAENRVERLMLERTSYKHKRPYPNLPASMPIILGANWLTNGKASPTRTYFQDSHSGLLKVALTIDPRYLMSADSGIYVQGAEAWDWENFLPENIDSKAPWWELPGNFHQRGRKSERPLYIEFYTSGHEPLYASAGGVRINGNATRAYPQKSLRLYAREEYGEAFFGTGFFKDSGPTQASNLILRNGGNDWDKCMLRDGLAVQIMAPLKLDCQRFRPAVVYINGEYWGIHNVRERMNEDHFMHLTGLPEDKIGILEKNAEVYHGEDVNEFDFVNLVGLLSEGEADAPDFVSMVEREMDVTAFFDYVLAECWLANTDWPGNNVKFWRPLAQPLTECDAEINRWRWILYDTDYGLAYTGAEAVETNMFQHLRRTNSFVSELFYGLLRSKELQSRFHQQAQRFLSDVVTVERTVALLDENSNNIADEMPNHIRRWRKIESMEQWQRNLDEIRVFLEKRNQYFEKQVDDLLQSVK